MNKQLGGGGEEIVPLYKEYKNSPYTGTEAKKIFANQMAEKPPQFIPQEAVTQINEPQPRQAYKGKNPRPPREDDDGGEFKTYQPHSKGPQSQAQQQLVNLQVYSQQPQKPKGSHETNFVYPDMTQPMVYPLGVPPQMMQPGNALNGVYGAVPPINVIKQISVGSVDPTGNHTALGLMYKDAPLHVVFDNTFATVSERRTINDYLRSVFFKHGDGKNIKLDGSKDSLLTKAKFLTLNPYTFHKHKRNPYKDAPRGFLLYNTCYPHTSDSVNGVMCAKGSMGLNVRIYRLLAKEYTEQRHTEYVSSKVWRDVAYYKYVNTVIDKCPHFTMMVGYYVSDDAVINFDKIEQIQGYNTLEEAQKAPLITTREPSIVPGLHIQFTGKPDMHETYTVTELKEAIARVKSNANPPSQPIPLGGGHLEETEHSEQIGGYDPSRFVPTSVRQEKNLHKKPSEEYYLKNPNKPVGSVVVITDSPTINFMSMLRKTYQMNNVYLSMTKSGFFTPQVWYSLLFQLASALYIMQRDAKVAFNSFSLYDNVFVKDLNFHSHPKFYKYKIDGIEYYVPNYGYLIMLDSNFKDIKDTTSTGVKLLPHVLGPHFGDTNSEQTIRDVNMNNFKTAFNGDNFRDSFTEYGGTSPPTEILQFLDQIRSEYTQSGASNNIGYYISKYFRRFLNNRIGTTLTEQEIFNIITNGNTNYKQGEIMAHEHQHNTYKFVLFVRPSPEEGKQCVILTKTNEKDEKFIEQTVPASELHQYRDTEPIHQTFKFNEFDIDATTVLETYILT